MNKLPILRNEIGGYPVENIVLQGEPYSFPLLIYFIADDGCHPSHDGGDIY